MEVASDLIIAMAQLIDALIWPLVALFMLYLLITEFGDVIREFFADAERLTLRGLGAEFVAEATNRTNRMSASNARIAGERPSTQGEPREQVDTREQSERPSDGGDPSQRLDNGNQRTAVIEAWLRLEREIRDILSARRVRGELRSFAHLLRALRSERLMNNYLYDLINELRTTRNIAAHEPEFRMDTEDAENYGDNIEFVIVALRRMERG